MFRQYDSILNSPELSPEDRKICERLILKKGKDLEWQWNSQELRKLIEKDRTRRYEVSFLFSLRLCTFETVVAYRRGAL